MSWLAGFMSDLMGGSREPVSSSDGNANGARGEIADGISIEMYVSPSDSSGCKVSANIDGNHVDHLEGNPKFD